MLLVLLVFHCKLSKTKLFLILLFRKRGAMTSNAKAFEASELVKLGCMEIDMVLNVGFLKSSSYQQIFDDIHAVVKATKSQNPKALVKVIFETCLLSKEEIADSAILSVLAGAEFVKTSTGFSKSGATLDDVFLMKVCVGEKAQVKASGGIRSYSDAIKMIEVGASRIGTSSGVLIVEEEKKS
jgi:deoxyribose-phosphate aldolase